jgi:hypothetical protein
LTGVATATDNCSDSLNIYYQDTGIPENTCGGDTINRTWYAVDEYGNISTCVQLIAINPAPAYPDDLIIWPADYTLTSCDASISSLNPDSLPSGFDIPVYPILPCQLVGYTYEDDTFQLCGNTIKINRTWQIVEWCSGEVFSHIQILKIECSFPIPFCYAVVNYSLGTDGTAYLIPDAINAGSYDPCGYPIEFRLRRSDGSGGVPMDSILLLDCTDVGDSILIELWVGNSLGQWDYCITHVNVEDKLLPIINCPNSISIDCDQDPNNLNLTGMATAIDNCSDSIHIYYVDGSSPSQCGGDTINRTWFAVDESGNTSSCVQYIAINPQGCGVPVAICNAVVNLSLGEDGMGYLFPDMFDAGSYDICGGPIEFRLRRSDGSMSVPLDSILFVDCDDIVDSIFIELWVGSQNGVWSSCFSSLNVEDKLPPTLTCPGTVSINCGDDLNDLGLTGVATATDNCSDSLNIYYVDDIEVSACGGETITRTWYAEDEYGNVGTCTQSIEVNAAPTLTDSLIIWPVNFEYYGCDLDSIGLLPENLPSENGEPQVLATSPCTQFIVSYQDIKTLPTCGDGFDLLREWTIIDWCTQEVFTHIQIIEINCSVPEAVCESATFVSLGQDGTAILIAFDLGIEKSDACGNILDFRIRISDGSTTVPTDSILAIDCSDVGDTLNVELWAGNYLGIWDFCIVQIIVEDDSGACTGSATTPQLTTTRLDERESLFRVYPNPASTEINLNFNVLDEGSSYLEFYSMDGRLIRRESNFREGNQRIKLSLENVPLNNFFIIRYFDGEEFHTEKVLNIK